MVGLIIYLFKDQIFSGGGASGSPNTVVTGSMTPTYIQGPTKPGDLPSDAVPVGSPDAPTTGWYQNRQAYAATLTVLPDVWKSPNEGAMQDIESIQAREGIPGNEQILRASYERLWAYRLNKLKLLPVEWNRLRAQYVSRYGGLEPDPNLQMVIPDMQMGMAINGETYLNAVNQYRQRMGLSTLGGIRYTIPAAFNVQTFAGIGNLGCGCGCKSCGNGGTPQWQ